MEFELINWGVSMWGAFQIVYLPSLNRTYFHNQHRRYHEDER
jgi:hypothetical protein